MTAGRAFFHTLSACGTCCRFTPSCSAYAKEAYRSLGLRRAIVVVFFRVLRCHPFSAGGYDPIPGGIHGR